MGWGNPFSKKANEIEFLYGNCSNRYNFTTTAAQIGGSQISLFIKPSTRHEALSAGLSFASLTGLDSAAGSLLLKQPAFSTTMPCFLALRPTTMPCFLLPLAFHPPRHLRPFWSYMDDVLFDYDRSRPLRCPPSSTSLPPTTIRCFPSCTTRPSPTTIPCFSS